MPGRTTPKSWDVSSSSALMAKRMTRSCGEFVIVKGFRCQPSLPSRNSMSNWRHAAAGLGMIPVTVTAFTCGLK